MWTTMTRRKRGLRRARCRHLCASEKRCTGIFGVKTGCRFYNPDAGRWLNRDQIGERGGPNETCFVNNAPTFYYDFLGLVGGIGIAWQNNHFVPPSMPHYPPFKPQPPGPGPQGNNISLLWPGLGCCNNPQRQLPIAPTIPGAVTPPSRPIPGNGVSAGHHQTFPSGTAAGSGGGWAMHSYCNQMCKLCNCVPLLCD